MFFLEYTKNTVPAGLEPATSRLTVGCSNQLSYGTEVIILKHRFYQNNCSNLSNNKRFDIIHMYNKNILN